jgi:Helix-turn-helix domain
VLHDLAAGLLARRGGTGGRASPCGIAVVTAEGHERLQEAVLGDVKPITPAAVVEDDPDALATAVHRAAVRPRGRLQGGLPPPVAAVGPAGMVEVGDRGPARPAREYVHGLEPGGVVLVPARAAAQLNQLVLDKLRVEQRGQLDPELMQVLIALRVAGENWLIEHGVPPGTVLTSISTAGGTAEVLLRPGREDSTLTVREAAHELGMTPRGVRRAIETGRLVAEQRDGRWFVSGAEVQEFRRVRTAAA